MLFDERRLLAYGGGERDMGKDALSGVQGSGRREVVDSSRMETTKGTKLAMSRAMTARTATTEHQGPAPGTSTTRKSSLELRLDRDVLCSSDSRFQERPRNERREHESSQDGGRGGVCSLWCVSLLCKQSRVLKCQSACDSCAFAFPFFPPFRTTEGCS